MSEKTTKRPMPVGKKFKKGEINNPAGRPKLPAEAKVARRMTHEHIAEIGSVILESDMDALKLLATDPKVSIVKKWTATVILKSMARGDHKALDCILDRVVGKVKERIEHSGDVKSPIHMKVEAMTSEERQRYIEESAKDLKEILDAD